jgi:uncharacterized protein (DUF433 family)
LRLLYGPIGNRLIATADAVDLRILKADWPLVNEYVEQRDGGYFVKQTRVSLDSVVHAFLRGESPEGIVDSFPVLNLEQVFGALAFYMASREVVDQYLSKTRSEFEVLREQSRRENPRLYAKLIDARRTIHTPGA